MLARSDGWTDGSLRECLLSLHRELVEDDAQRERRGRDSNRFEFHDSGSAAIVEALASRVSDAGMCASFESPAIAAFRALAASCARRSRRRYDGRLESRRLAGTTYEMTEFRGGTADAMFSAQENTP